MQCIHFVIHVLQPACSFTCTLSAGRFLPGRCRFMGDRKRTSSSSPSALDSHFPFMASAAHVFPEQCCRLFLSPCAAFQRQTEREKLGYSESLGLVPTASSASLCTPTMWRAYRDMSLFQLTSGRHLLQL